jgi:hypothetical protein
MPLACSAAPSYDVAYAPSAPVRFVSFPSSSPPSRSTLPPAKGDRMR